MRANTCSRCRCWGGERLEGHDIGTCRLNGPRGAQKSALKDARGFATFTHVSMGEWTFTRADDWCAKFEPPAGAA